jgi:SMC interacting uncharacterized protein involved in chromosome segregation
MFCERETTWVYDWVITHSRCKECGGVSSLSMMNVNALRKIFVKEDKRDAEIKKLKNEVFKLRGRIKRQAKHITGLQNKLFKRGVSVEGYKDEEDNERE